MRKRLLRTRPVVLVADDDAATRRAYRSYLLKVGCRVITASDGEVAVTRAIEHLPDVVIMDLAMPKLDGWAATRILKRRTTTSRIPVIALAGPNARHSAHAAGCDAYLSKPCQPDMLWCQIRMVLHDVGVMWGEMTRT